MLLGFDMLNVKREKMVRLIEVSGNTHTDFEGAVAEPGLSCDRVQHHITPNSADAGHAPA